MPAATVHAIPTTATDVQADIRNTLDARTKLQSILEALRAERAAATTDLVKQVTRDLAAATAPTSDRLFDAYKNWRTKDEHTAEKIAALEDLAVKVQARVDEFRAQPALKDELANALRLKIAALTESKGEHDEQSDAIRAHIKKLREELDGLGIPAAYATTAAAARTPRKGT
jgi:chromosome segregation ATPase